MSLSGLLRKGKTVLFDVIEGRFFEYVAPFKGASVQSDSIISLKEKHSVRVCREIEGLGLDLKISEKDMITAKISAILHDVGRFPQYEKYGTFQDGISVDHARLGHDVIVEKNLLDGVEFDEKDLILRAILYHNRANIPEDETDRCMFFSRLLRDADKLDIWHVLLEDYLENGGKGCAQVEAQVPMASDISSIVYDDIMDGNQVKVSHISNMNDLKAYRCGWIHDINTAPAMIKIRDRRYLEKMRSTMPDTMRVREVFDFLLDAVNRRIDGFA